MPWIYALVGLLVGTQFWGCDFSLDSTWIQETEECLKRFRNGEV